MITRRTFLKSAVAGLVASSIPAYALAPLTIGIGTFSYHALSFDDMIAQLEILLPTNGLHNQQIVAVSMNKPEEINNYWLEK